MRTIDTLGVAHAAIYARRKCVDYMFTQVLYIMKGFIIQRVLYQGVSGKIQEAGRLEAMSV